MKTAIKLENISKQYRLGNVGLGTIGADLNRWYQTSLRGREDPYLKIGEENDRSVKGQSEYIWALRDINFEVKQGEVLGIIGRNGAGKSTLLKILSRTTAPTTGQIKIKGHIASLLEVGTGFHPELTGRENIFLNGAILGMSRNEIKSKFEEIVDFAGVERYIDTPVKRYSSGMYVRLAFGVAAHLEPEILIVDEVLAVGDAEFQKKALGKMKDISEGQGRTVLFVSHNMDTVSSLTSHAILLDNGNIIANGPSKAIIKNYLEFSKPAKGSYEKEPNMKTPSIIKVDVITSESEGIHKNGEELLIDIEVFIPEVILGMALSFQIYNSNENAIVFTCIFDIEQPFLRKKGINKVRCTIPGCKLYQGYYYLKMHLAETKGRAKFQEIDKICEFEVKMMKRPIEWGWQPDICVYTEDFHWELID